MNSTDFATAESRWRAIVKRDRRAESAFLYAVKTTGVYCRPGCGSRPPKREHVEFFHDSQAAELAGYRPCRRCMPDSSSPHQRRAQLVERACKRIEQSAERLKLSELAGEAQLSPYHFQRLFKTITGVTPKQYAAACRLRRFRNGLEQGGSVTHAIYAAGFGSSSRAYQSAASLGMTPSAYRNGGAGLQIHFAAAPCSLGWVLIGTTERGICAIEFGDDPAALQEQLKGQFPKAHIDPARPELASWLEQVLAFIESPALGLKLPLDIRGTAFQQRVWQALRDIPPGRTASYTEIAGQIGSPQAIRAVARACASNRLAVAIPCHRVVRRDGDLCGYRWGIERKRALLEREAADSASKHATSTTAPSEKT